MHPTLVKCISARKHNQRNEPNQEILRRGVGFKTELDGGLCLEDRPFFEGAGLGIERTFDDGEDNNVASEGNSWDDVSDEGEVSS